MSGGPVCKCGKRDAWRVLSYRCNYSAFNGGRFTPSDYSSVFCDHERGGCGAVWRTKARYVDGLPRYRSP
jgi:hypothetical protein